MDLFQSAIRNQSALALLFLRTLLGIIFLMQGYGKVFGYGVEQVYSNYFTPYSAVLPDFIVKFTAYFTSYVELVAGFLLCIGLFRFLSYLLLAMVLIIVSFGHGLLEPIWDLHHVFVRSALLFALLFIPFNLDLYSLDEKILKHRNNAN